MIRFSSLPISYVSLVLSTRTISIYSEKRLIRIEFFSVIEELEMTTTTEAATSYNTENTSSKKINVQSNETNGKIYEIDEGIIEQSSTIKELSDSMLICL
jgi:hypothetical protein